MPLKNYVFLIFCTLILSCNKPDKPSQAQLPPEPVDTSDTLQIVKDTFTAYYILKGNNYCEKNTYPVFRQSKLKFIAIFDNSCIYSNANPDNQGDINKLYGFSDCSTLHHANSARFGWNWKDGKVHIHAYCYVNETRQSKELGIVDLNKEVNCSIDLLAGKYIFTLNGKKDTMQRYCSDTIAYGIKLFPYFGGDEPAPHDITIRIKEITQ